MHRVDVAVPEPIEGAPPESVVPGGEMPPQDNDGFNANGSLLQVFLLIIPRDNNNAESTSHQLIHGAFMLLAWSK